MVTHVKHKRVEFTELFYDLVFVYAISKTTGIIHHLHHGILSTNAVVTFLICLIVLVNTWIIQSEYTNRYGKNSLFNIVIMVIDMGLLLLLSNVFNSDWQAYFYPFSWALGTLSLTLLIQYIVQYFSKDSDQNDKEVIKLLLYVLSVRTITVYLGTLFPYSIGIWICLTGIFTSFLMPLFAHKKLALVPLNFPHLVERVSLLVIITFGEMILGVADYFNLEKLSLNSVFYFLICVLMFLYYFGEFDHAIDENKNTSGIILIYSHYLIFAGIIMTTVSLSFLSDYKADPYFVVIFLYIGIFLFQQAIHLNGIIYNKPEYHYSKSYLLAQLMLFFVAFGVSLLLVTNSDWILYITTTMLLISEVIFLNFQYLRAKDKQI